jgi:hypothetical protein
MVVAFVVIILGISLDAMADLNPLEGKYMKRIWYWFNYSIWINRFHVCLQWCVIANLYFQSSYIFFAM